MLTTLPVELEIQPKLKQELRDLLDRLDRRARHLVRDSLLDACRSSSRPCASRWAKWCLRLDRQYEGTTARYDVESRPWWRQIIAAVTDPDVRSVTIKASTQVGKTLTLIAALLYLAENDPAPMMVVMPDEASAIEFRDRLYGNAEASIAGGRVQRLKVPPEYKRNTRYCDLGTCRVYLAWSQARQRLRGRPCRRVFLSETDVYEGDKRAGDPVAQSHQRTKAFHRYLHYHESSPTEEPSPIGRLEAKASARYRWHAKCPHCGQPQELRFCPLAHGAKAGKGGICGWKTSAGEIKSAADARREAHYVCEQGCVIEERDRLQFVRNGEWVLLDACRPPPGEELDRRSLGFHLWAIHSETQTFGDLAASYVDAHEEGKLRDWWGNMLGLEWKPAQKIAFWAEVGARLAAEHPRGTVPAAAWFLTAGVDVQHDGNGVRYSIRAWGAHRTSWLVDWGWIERPDEQLTQPSLVRQDLVAAGKAILDTSFPVHLGRKTELLGLSALPVRMTLVDTGHSPRAVHTWSRSLPPEWVIGEGSERVRMIKGAALQGARYQRGEIDADVRTGEVYEGGMVVWRLNVAEFYPEFCDWLFLQPGKPGSWHVTSDTLTLGKSYLQQVCNMERRVVLDRSGRPKVEWGPRSRVIPVDFFDTEVYSAFAAEMVVGDFGWDPAPWQAWADKRKDSAARRPVRQPRVQDEDLADR